VSATATRPMDTGMSSDDRVCELTRDGTSIAKAVLAIVSSVVAGGYRRCLRVEAEVRLRRSGYNGLGWSEWM